MKDSHYTPFELAEYLVNFIPKNPVKNVADFCIGGGELLKAYSLSFPFNSNEIQYYGTDISKAAIKNIKKKYPSWNVGICDFLNPRSRNSSTILKIKFDVILMNPPFTCKGGTVSNIILDNYKFTASTSMAFVSEALKYLNKNGVLFAILPQSVAYSQKDKAIREFLSEKYNFRILEERNNQHFEKCAPNIVLISINDNKKVPNKKRESKRLSIPIQNISVKRGNISMYKIKEVYTQFNYLVHSTNLVNGEVAGMKYKVDKNRSTITGPALLIHRVGTPNKDKLCLITENETYSLSDCVIAIKTDNISDSIELKRQILANWNVFDGLYKGTGARYITLERLYTFLHI